MTTTYDRVIVRIYDTDKVNNPYRWINTLGPDVIRQCVLFESRSPFDDKRCLYGYIAVRRPITIQTWRTHLLCTTVYIITPSLTPPTSSSTTTDTGGDSLDDIYYRSILLLNSTIIGPIYTTSPKYDRIRHLVKDTKALIIHVDISNNTYTHVYFYIYDYDIIINTQQWLDSIDVAGAGYGMVIYCVRTVDINIQCVKGYAVRSSTNIRHRPFRIWKKFLNCNDLRLEHGPSSVDEGIASINTDLAIDGPYYLTTTNV